MAGYLPCSIFAFLSTSSSSRPIKLCQYPGHGSTLLFPTFIHLTNADDLKDHQLHQSTNKKHVPCMIIISFDLSRGGSDYLALHVRDNDVEVVIFFSLQIFQLFLTSSFLEFKLYRGLHARNASKS